MKTSGNSTGFTGISHTLFKGILLADLNQREMKVILLILRITNGCHSFGARIKNADLKIIGIGSQHAKKVLEPMINKGMILVHEKNNRFKVNETFFEDIVFSKENENERLIKLIGKHLPNRGSSQNGNTNVPKMEHVVLPKREVETSQNGNTYPLPKREHSGSNSGGFQSMIDILNKRL